MDTITTFAPTPGSAKPGNLYADLGSRTLWLGVDPAVDPSQAVLISDIVSLQANINQTLVDAKAYADSQVATRALTSHTHTASQITDFNSAVSAVVAAAPGLNWVRGMIMQYSGSLADIGVGGLAGWALCDGANGTPNLRDKFILGAGNKPIGNVNPTDNFDTTLAGGHTHTVNATALSIAQLPSHAHGSNTGTVSADHSHTFSGTSGADSPDHTHGPTTALNANAGGTPVGGLVGGTSVQYRASDGASARHSHSFSGTTSGISANHTHNIPAEGSGQTHTHTLVGGGGAHQHNITGIQMRDALAWYALAFIMKL